MTLERGFDAKLAGMADTNGPVDLLGATRGVYLDGYGVVFTTEMGLVVTPTVNPFNADITETQKDRVHSAKVTRLPALKKAITDMVKNLAPRLSQVPDTQQIVVAVRLDVPELGEHHRVTRVDRRKSRSPLGDGGQYPDSKSNRVAATLPPTPESENLSTNERGYMRLGRDPARARQDRHRTTWRAPWKSSRSAAIRSARS